MTGDDRIICVYIIINGVYKCNFHFTLYNMKNIDVYNCNHVRFTVLLHNTQLFFGFDRKPYL